VGAEDLFPGAQWSEHEADYSPPLGPRSGMRGALPPAWCLDTRTVGPYWGVNWR
jgi:hypothetical protein